MNRVDKLLEALRSPPPPDTGAGFPGSEPEPIWAEPFHEAWMANEGCEYRIRLARSQAAELAAARPSVRAGELVVGDNRLHSMVTAMSRPFGNCIRVDDSRAEELRQQHPDRAHGIDTMLSYWREWLAQNPSRIGMTCHASPAYERILELGIDGLRAYVEEWQEQNIRQRPECAAWYDALLIMLEGMSGFINAHARAARAAADGAEDATQCAELEGIARNCRNVAHGKPRSFHEAVQLFYLVYWMCGHDSPGPIDRYLYPALKRDLAAGRISLEEAQEIVDCLWCKFAAKTAYGATIAGQNRDGSDATNELSYLCLRSIRRLRLLSPRTALRWHPGLSDEFLNEAVDTVAEGASFPVFVNDEAIVAAAVERGVALEDAREYTFVGCGQTYPHGRGHGNYEDIVINTTKALELALHDGMDSMSGERAGPATGAPHELTTYEALEAAYRQQIDTMISHRIHQVNERRLSTSGQAFDFLRSLLTWSCVKRGLDWHEGGVEYSEGMVDLVGLTTVTDSLVALKLGVYGSETVSLPELVSILDRGWEGDEPLRQFFLKGLPKLGNGSPEADGQAVAELERLNSLVKSHRTCFGGPWGIDIIGWSGAVIYGESTGATPDGRRARRPVADCAGPAQGRNTCGLTQTLESMLGFPHSHVHGPLALSLRFPPSVVDTSAARAKLRAAVECYFQEGGQQVQISVAGTEEMRAAQADPEAHRSLIVRVGGFSAYFVELDAKWQNDMIARSEMALG